MTVGVALKCRDSVILACDSQATGGYKDLTTKLEQLDGYLGSIWNWKWETRRTF